MRDAVIVAIKLCAAGWQKTTFNIPDFIWRHILGADSNNIGQTSDGTLPAITGTFGFVGGQWGNPGFGNISGAFYASKTEPGRDTSGDGYRDRVSTIAFNASRSAGAYSRKDNQVFARYLTVGIIIKY